MHVLSYKRYYTSLLYYYGLIDRSIESPIEVDIITGVEVEVGVIVASTGVDANNMIYGVILVILLAYS